MLQEHYFEDEFLVRKQGAIFTRKRGYEFRLPKKNKSVILFLSGGLDSVSLWYLLLKKYKLHVYPLYVDDGSSHTASEKKSIEFFSKLFKKLFSSHFHSHYYLSGQVFFSFQNISRKSIFNDENLIFSNVNLQKPNDAQPVVLPTNPARLFYYAALGYEYLLHLKYALGVKINTVIVGITPSDSISLRESTRAVLRSINVALCSVLGDYSIQFIGPLEKEGNFYYRKHDLVSRAVIDNIPIHKTWSCVSQRAIHCGQCPNCRTRKRIFAETGLIDNTNYQKIFSLLTTAEKIKYRLRRIFAKYSLINTKKNTYLQIDKSISIPPHIKWKDYGEKVVVYNKFNLKIKEFMASSLIIWRTLQKRNTSLASLLVSMRKEYPGEKVSILENDLRLFLELCLKDGFIKQ
ncbi:7-cyano-7-deazaguanine synthase [Candidatus Roizmanbacteria bacterium]|nr:7-cyano-7-deazaguanine synthase [Candidatus Roizmanbacteria bacterium]